MISPPDHLPRGVRRTSLRRTLTLALGAAGIVAAGAALPSANAQAAAWQSINTNIGTMTALAVSPTQPQVLYVGGHYSPGMGGLGVRLARSDDGGRTWNDLTTGAKQAINSPPDSLAVAPNTPRRVLYGSTRGVHLSLNGGVTWRAANGGLPPAARDITQIEFSRTNPRLVYAGTKYAGVYRSTNAGLTWSAAANGLPPAGDRERVAALAVAPGNGNVAYVAFGTAGNLFRTVDGGANWTSIYANLRTWSSGQPMDRVQAFAVSHTNPQRVYAAVGSTVARSDDGGASWDHGIDRFDTHSDIIGLAIDPRDDTRLYAHTTYDLFQSTDAAQSWSAVPKNQAPREKVLREMVIPPNRTPLMYVRGTQFLHCQGTPPAGATTLTVPAPTVRVLTRAARLQVTVTAALGTAARGRTAQVQYLRGKRWIAAARVRVPANGRINRRVALTRAQIGGAKVRQLRVRIVVAKAGANSAAIGKVRVARIPAR